MKVEKIVNSIMTSVTYILSEKGCNDVWLVDCGDVDRIVEFVGERNIRGVLLTHVHYDHIYGLPRILDLYPDCRVFTNSVGKEELVSAKLNLSKYYEDPIEVTDKAVSEVREGDAIDISTDIKAKVYETPGHSPSCLCFEVCDYLFTGDAYIPGIKVVTNLPGGDKRLAKESRERILSMLSRHQLYPGHVNLYIQECIR